MKGTPITDWTRKDYESFVHENYSDLFRWVARLSGSQDAAGDLTQEAFAEFWASLGRRHVRHPRRWLFRVARNRFRKWCRAQSRVESYDHSADRMTFARTPDLPFNELESHVVRLPTALREAITLRYWSDFSIEEVAAVQGATRTLVRWRLYRGRQILKKSLMENNSIRMEIKDEYRLAEGIDQEEPVFD